MNLLFSHLLSIFACGFLLKFNSCNDMLLKGTVKVFLFCQFLLYHHCFCFTPPTSENYLLFFITFNKHLPALLFMVTVYFNSFGAQYHNFKTSYQSNREKDFLWIQRIITFLKLFKNGRGRII